MLLINKTIVSIATSKEAGFLCLPVLIVQQISMRSISLLYWLWVALVRSDEQMDIEKETANSIEDKHVPVAVEAPLGCCDGGCGIVRGCATSVSVCQNPPIIMPSFCKNYGEPKHVPVSISVPIGCCDGSCNQGGVGCGCTSAACSNPEIYIPTINDSTSTRKTSTKTIDDKYGCETVINDPLTSTVTVTGTTYTTFISTLRRIFRETTYSTTTVTSTVRLTKTELSITARTITTEVFFTLPTFVLITKYSYVDSTTTTTTTGLTFIGTITITETVQVNQVTRTTTTTSSTELTTKTTSTELLTTQLAGTYTFTDQSNVFITAGTSTASITISLTLTLTQTRTLAETTVLEFTSVTSVTVPSEVFVNYITPTQVLFRTTISLYDPSPQATFIPISTNSILIS